MEKVESTIRKDPEDEGINQTGLPVEKAGSNGGAPADGERTRIGEMGAQPLRATTPTRELVKRSAPIRKPETGAFHKTVGLVRTALPLIQKALPLLDGNVAAAIANLLMPTFQGQSVDLTPLENGLAKLRVDQAAVQSRVEAQGTALKQVGNQLESLKDAAERLSLEQKELAEELHGLRTRVGVFAWIGVGLLVVLVVVNVLLLLRVVGIWR